MVYLGYSGYCSKGDLEVVGEVWLFESKVATDKDDGYNKIGLIGKIIC